MIDIDVRIGGALASTADMLFATGEVERKPGQRNTTKSGPKPFKRMVNRVERCMP